MCGLAAPIIVQKLVFVKCKFSVLTLWRLRSIILFIGWARLRKRTRFKKLLLTCGAQSCIILFMDWEIENKMFKITKNLLDFSRSVLYNIILNRNTGEELEPSNIVHIKKEIDMTTTTVANYTPEMTAELVTRYLAGEPVETLAAFAGKTTRSIVAKLSREGVYVAKTKTKAEVRVKKAELVSQLATRLGVDEESVGDLEKLTAKTLGLLLSAV